MASAIVSVVRGEQQIYDKKTQNVQTDNREEKGSVLSKLHEKQGQIKSIGIAREERAIER